MKHLKYCLISLVLALLAYVFLAGLSTTDSVVVPTLINKPAPEVNLAVYQQEGQLSSVAKYRGKVVVLNIWATWCVSCLEEYDTLKQWQLPPDSVLIGLNYKDDLDKVERWLKLHGQVFREIWVDEDGQGGIEYGVYGVPETLIINKQGNIIFRHSGLVTGKVIETLLMPVLQQALKE